jgi:hypothetical protein
MAVFWVVALCSLVEVYQCFRGPCLHHQLKMEAARTSETLVNFYQTEKTAIFVITVSYSGGHEFDFRSEDRVP